MGSVTVATLPIPTESMSSSHSLAVLIAAASLLPPLRATHADPAAHEAVVARSPRHVGASGRVTTIIGREVWTAATPIRVDGPVTVAPGGTLVIEAGTQIEGVVGAYIIVSRDARIEALGTLRAPIALTCSTATKYPGCWGGLLVQGYARINRGTPTSPISATRSPVGGCLEAVDPVASPSRFGGCNDADNSGTLRFMRIEYAERGLHLAGVGSATVIHDVQANRTRSEGVLVTGGTADVRNLFLTANGTGLRWTAGWRGRAQSIAVQQDIARFIAGVVGQNGSTESASDAVPRSAPTLYNLTLIAQSSAANPTNATARALVLERGTGGSLRNIFLYAPNIALDLAGSSVCTQLSSGTLTLRHVLTAGATRLGEGTVSGCPSTEAALLSSLSESNSVLASASGLLTSENDLYLPDLRPLVLSALATAPAEAPPFDGFFTRGNYIGAVPRNFAPGSIPWFSGWTSPAPPPAPIPTGTITGVVRSPLRGLLRNVRVTDEVSGTTTLTDASGVYSLTLPAGTALLDVSQQPTDCPAPATRSGTVNPNTSATLDLRVDCPPLPGSETITAGDGFACGITGPGSYCWGENAFGQLGDGTTTAKLLPAVLNVQFTSLSAGAQHACGRVSSGTVRCWGEGSEGQVGDGSGASRNAPTSGPSGNYVMVTSGGSHSCALTANGHAFCWGSNSNGQLGNGGSARSLAPVEVVTSRSFATLAAGRRHTCALDVTGAAWCWGANAQGQLGDGTTTDRSQPVAVLGGIVFKALAGGGDAHSCATNAAGFVSCWGANDVGQLGNGSTMQSTVPRLVTTALTLTNVALGDRHSCGIAFDGSARCWGANEDGQIGDGTSGSRTSPTIPDASALFNQMTAGSGFSCGVTFGAVTGEDNVIVISRRSLLCWGRNSSGQFGRGSTTSALTPTAAATGLVFP